MLVRSSVFLSVFSYCVIAYGQNNPAADCVINPYQVTDLSSPVAGVIKSVLVGKSEKVEAGQLVARLESSVEQATVNLARIRAKIESEIDESKVQVAFDGKRKNRFDSLYQRKTISEDLKDDVDREEQLALVRLQQAKELKSIRELELARAQAQLNQKTIRSPIDGFVLQQFKRAGEYVEEQAIVRVAQLDPLSVEAILPIEMFGKIEVGQTASVHLNAFAGKQYDARVKIVDPMGNAASGTFGVTLELPNKSHEIPAGLKCSVVFTD
jgi:RND family efflux transporter MFP subunit